MTSDATDLDARLAQVESDMAKSDPRYVSEAVREIVTLGRAVLALVYKPDPQDCPTCRALIEATMRELDEVTESGARRCSCPPWSPGVYSPTCPLDVHRAEYSRRLPQPRMDPTESREGDER